MPTPLPRYDGAPVVVVGNGPVGQTVALLLARWNIPVILLDQLDERDLIGSKAICQQRDVLDIWEAVGAGEQIAAAGVTWRMARTYYRDAELFSYDLDDAASHFPPFVNISQTQTEAILDDRISDQPLIDVRWGHTVTDVADGDGYCAVTCRTAGTTAVLRTPYVVMCGGARSDALRSALGVTFEGTSFDDRFLICDLRADVPEWQTERRFYFDPVWNPGRQVLIHPCPGSTFRIDWQVPSNFSLAEEEASGGLHRRIEHIIGSRPYDIVWSSVYRFHARIVDRMRVGRVLLAGDAAHLIAPFGARGLNSGVADAENAAWKLAFVLHGWAPDALLDSYHDERHAAAMENLEVTTATMDFLVPQSARQAKLRRAALERATHDKTAITLIDSGRLAEPFWYSSSPLTTAHPGRPVAGRPPRGQTLAAAPGTLLADLPLTAPEQRLRAIVRDGMLLLCGTNVDTLALLEQLPPSSAPVTARTIDRIDRTGALTAALDCNPGDIWVIRPDGYVAAALNEGSAQDVSAALARALGHTVLDPARA